MIIRLRRLLQSADTSVDLAAEPLEEVHSVPPIEATAEEDDPDAEPEEPDEIDLLSEDEDDDL